MPDAIVIGAGPNGLVAAATLARCGWSVVVVEAKSRPGGALYSEEFTLPGYIHDVGAAFFPFAQYSPALRSLELEAVGLEWRHAERDSAHPAPDGSCATISRNLDLACASFGIDGRAWERLVLWQREMEDRLVKAVVATLPGIGGARKLGLRNIIKFGALSGCTPAMLSHMLFKSEAARRVIPGLSLHVDLGPNDFAGAGLGLMLGLLASSSGFPVPVGGARSITQCLVRRLEEAGGKLELNYHVNRIGVRNRRAVEVDTAKGCAIPAKRAILADVGAPSLFLKLLQAHDTGTNLCRRLKRFRYGWGTFKMDWALSGPVPWRSQEARESAVVHAGDSIADLVEFTRQVRSGELPNNPYLVIGQQSIADPTRAPVACHTLWAYSHVPSVVEGGWTAAREAFADRVEARIERLAPGFRQLIQARAIHSPVDLEKMNENLVGGDLGGGSAHVDHQLFFRPVFPYFRYRTPIRGLYLCSASAHPGAGVHGACGYNAARAAIEDFEKSHKR
jgi:phytoene dehydrogenase-like protein